MNFFKCGKCSTETYIIDESCVLLKCLGCKTTYDWRANLQINMGDEGLSYCPHCKTPNTHKKKKSDVACLNCKTLYNTKDNTETEEEDKGLKINNKCTGFTVKKDHYKVYCNCGGEVVYSHRAWMCSESGVEYPIPEVKPKSEDPLSKHELWSFDIPTTISETSKAIHCITEVFDRVDLTHNQQIAIAEWFYIEYGAGANR